MKILTIGFSRSKKPLAVFSKAIQVWDGTNYSHVYFEFKSFKYDVDMIYQSSVKMLNYMSKDVFLLNNIIVEEFQLTLTTEQYVYLMTSCMKSAGLPYGTLQIVGIVLADVLKLQKNPFSHDQKYHCSEWVAEKLQEVGYKFNKDLDLVKPIDVYKVLKHETQN